MGGWRTEPSFDGLARLLRRARAGLRGGTALLNAERRDAVAEADERRDRGDAAGAAVRYAEVIARWGETYGLLVKFGNALKDSGACDRAREIYDSALALDPPDVDAQRLRILGNLGNALKDQGLLDEAEKVYLAALGVEPHDPDCHLQLGHVMKLSGRPARAEHYYRRANALDPLLQGPAEELAALDAARLARASAPPPPGPDRSRRAVMLRERLADGLARRRN